MRVVTRTVNLPPTSAFLAAVAVMLCGEALRGQSCLTWVEAAQPQVRPAAREHHAMAYDAMRDRIVVFGGYDGVSQLFGDTWEWDGAVWTQHALPPANSPGPREAGALAYDAVRGVAVFFGGDDVVGAYRGDTWEWDGTIWSLRAAPPDPGPSPRSGHGLAYDAARGVCVLFGGEGDGGAQGDTWTWDGAAWTQHVVSGPSARAFHAMAYDSGRHVTVLAGGANGPVHSGESWEWDGSAWNLRSAGGPSPRSFQAMSYDAARRVTVLFAGNPGFFQNNRETWEWNGAEWTLRLTEGPSERHNPLSVYDVARGAVTLFGGHDWNVVFNDMWRLRRYESCDLNCDGSLNLFDIQPFLGDLSGGTPCGQCAGDANGDGTVNPFDINAFLACLA